MKTAHELAKELLAGPNLPIFHFDASKAGTDDEIDTSISEPKIEKVDEPYTEAFLTICDSHDYPEALTESESALRAENAALKAKCEELTGIEKSANAHHGKDGGKLIVPDDPLSRATYWKARAQSAKGQLATLTERNAALEKALTETCGFMEESSLIGICTLTKSIRAVLAKNKEAKS